tara:strand:+ start:71 stop:505 length:435 start_codon:yes stop_codon:yes gene_type:complete
MRTKVIFLLLAVSFLSVSTTGQGPTITAVATVKQLCQGVITASSDALFNVGREAPASDYEWTVLHNDALMLAESGNLLMIGERARDADEWMVMSQELVDAGVVAVKAVEARNTEEVLAAGDRIVMVCEKCHEPYRDGGISMPIR